MTRLQRLLCILATVILACSTGVGWAQTAVNKSISDCDPSRLSRASGFEMQFDPALRQTAVGQKGQALVLVRFPKSGAEINQARELQCSDFIPDKAEIVRVEVTQVSGLPAGVKWRNAVGQKVFSGGEAACFWLEGAPEAVGRYAIQIHSQGSGRFLGISSTSRCVLSINGVTVTP